MFTKFAPLLIAVALAGCATSGPTSAPPAEMTDALVGPKPTQDSIKEFVAAKLKDPDSAKFQMGPTTKCYMREAPISGGKISQYGWCTFLSVAGKNSYGAYVGFKPVRVFTSSLSVNYIFSANMWHSESWYRE